MGGEEFCESVMGVGPSWRVPNRNFEVVGRIGRGRCGIYQLHEVAARIAIRVRRTLWAPPF